MYLTLPILLLGVFLTFERINGETDVETHEFQGRKYLFIKRKMNFLTAEAACARKGMKLATIDSKEEQDFINSHHKDGLWIGLFFLWEGIEQTQKDNLWHWIATGNELTYKNWCTGEDSDQQFKEEACAVNWYDEKGKWPGCWVSWNCFTVREGGICEEQKKTKAIVKYDVDPLIETNDSKCQVIGSNDYCTKAKGILTNLKTLFSPIKYLWG